MEIAIRLFTLNRGICSTKHTDTLTHKKKGRNPKPENCTLETRRCCIYTYDAFFRVVLYFDSIMQQKIEKKIMHSKAACDYDSTVFLINGMFFRVVLYFDSIMQQKIEKKIMHSKAACDYDSTVFLINGIFFRV